MTEEQKTARLEALKLLRRYDRLKAELRTLEPELAKACAHYGRLTGRWGFRDFHLRNEAEEKAKRAA